VTKKAYLLKLVLPKTYKERRYAMNVEITVPEGVEIFKEIQAVPEKLFQMSAWVLR